MPNKFSFSTTYCCWKNVDKNLSRFVDRFDGSLYAEWLPICTDSKYRLLGYYFCVVAIVYSIISIIWFYATIVVNHKILKYNYW